MPLHGIALTVAVFLLIAPLSPAALATQPSTAPMDPALAALIEQLSSRTYHERQTAQDELVKRGEAARSALQKLAASSANEEVRTAAGAVLARIDAEEANAPTLITLHVKDADPRVVL